jgi:HEAT repeat protein
MGVKARPVLPDLLTMLMAPAPRRNPSLMGASGVTISRWQSPPSRKPYAQAILSIDANGAEAVDAHVYLIEHGDSYERHESVKSLGALGTASPLGISSLLKVANNTREKAATRYEAITTLGMIGPLAAPAIFVLRTLTKHDDPQIAERAKAALRQIRITL